VSDGMVWPDDEGFTFDSNRKRFVNMLVQQTKWMTSNNKTSPTGTKKGDDDKTSPTGTPERGHE
jgi:hypothetical protein